jgi:polygalacturonase
MPCIRSVFVKLLFLLSVSITLFAQDTRKVSEPMFPPVCSILRAPLGSSSDGPLLADNVIVQDEESSDETQMIIGAIDRCPKGYAVEFALGSDMQHNAFLINPLTFPAGISLIIDGGVTVYASRNPTNYQIDDPVQNPNRFVCGTVAGPPKPLTGVCQPVLTFLGDPKNKNKAKNGLYGYGVLDGQGQANMLWPPNPTGVIPPPMSWWGLLLVKRDEGGDDADVNENSPIMVSAGGTPNTLANDFTMYKITIRNPPFHTVSWGGDGLTVWGVRVQAPWNESNTDGFDLHGSNGTLYDTIVANGDDDIAFAINNGDTRDITVRHFAAYARDGITVLGDGNGTYSIHDLLMDDILITGSLPSVVTSTNGGVTTGTVNGVDEAALKSSKYNVTGYAQALPNALSYVHGLNVKYQSASIQKDITFRNVCIQDVRTPLNIIEDAAPTSTTEIENVRFENIHVLAPSAQYENYDYGKGTSDGPGTGRYLVNFGGVPGAFHPQFTLSNVVFDDLPADGATPISSIVAKGSRLSTLRNVYPSVFNDLTSTVIDDTPPPSPWPGNKNVSLTLSDNLYGAMTPTSTPKARNRCDSPVPFITGELFASKESPLSASDGTNLSVLTTTAGSSIALNAVVQPIMSQTSYVLPGANNDTKLNVVAIGSPVLTNAVSFYDGSKYVGSAALSANGTLARLRIKNIGPGMHVFTAQYAKDQFYDTLNFGLVVVYASPWK